MEIYINSSYDLSVNVSGAQLRLVAGERAKLDLDGERSCLIGVVPINELGGNYFLPYCFDLNLDAEPVVECEFCFVQKSGSAINLHLMPKCLNNSNLFTSFTFNSMRYTLTQNNFDNTVILRNDNQTTELAVDFVVKNVNFYSKTFSGKTYFFLELTAGARAYLVFATDPCQPIFAGELQSYEWQENLLTLVERFDGELCQIRMQKFYFDTDCKRVDCKVGYAYNRPAENKVSVLAPYLFLECVVAGNVPYAKSLLEGDLKDRLTADMMKSFFPEFDNFYQTNDTNSLSPFRITITKKGHPVGILDFEMNGLKIANIKFV